MTRDAATLSRLGLTIARDPTQVTFAVPGGGEPLVHVFRLGHEIILVKATLAQKRPELGPASRISLTHAGAAGGGPLIDPMSLGDYPSIKGAGGKVVLDVAVNPS